MKTSRVTERFLSIESAVRSGVDVVLGKLDTIRQLQLRMKTGSHRRSTLDPVIARKMQQSQD